MSELFRIVADHFALLLTIWLLWIGGGFAYFAWRSAGAARPTAVRRGGRQVRRDIRVRLLAARPADQAGRGAQCAAGTVTREWLIIEPAVPFKWFLSVGFADLEHALPKSEITSIEPASASGRDSVRLQFRGADGVPRTVELILRRPQEFVAALREA